MKIEVDLRDDVLDQQQEAELVRQTKESIVLHLFGERRIASGLAVRLLDLNRIQFMELCQQRGVPMVDYTAEDFQDDMATLDRILGKGEANVADDRRLE